MGTPERKNRNRGYRKLIVWTDAIELFRMTCETFRGFPFELKKVASQQIACTDSIHRNIAEGYCRRSIKEYLGFLNIALGSLGEAASGLHACHAAKQIPAVQHEQMDSLAYKLENGMLKLIEALQKKKERGDWIDSLWIKENEDRNG